MSTSIVGSVYKFTGQELEYDHSIIQKEYLVFAAGYTEALETLQHITSNVKFIGESSNPLTIQNWLKQIK